MKLSTPSKPLSKTMSSFTTTAATAAATATPPLHAKISKPHQRLPHPPIKSSITTEKPTQRRNILSTVLATTMAIGLQPINPPQALSQTQSWGTRSFLKERFFEPGLSAEDAVERIKQTREGLHSIREMLETMSWRYVLFYIRLKSAYLSQDLKNAMSTLPDARKQDYVKTANELVDNMSEFDYYVRTPKIYESYVYYEKALKSIDDLVALLA